jgi:hypothetical protein
LGVLKIVLSANKSNPITRGINNSVEWNSHSLLPLIDFFIFLDPTKFQSLE